jgi:tryptophan synthase alpha chain
MNGVERITQTFVSCRADGRAALMPYYTLGFPTQKSSLAVVEAIAAAGADLIELGMPFSDPLADGPTIQRSTQVALEQGMSVERCLEMTADLTARGLSQPLLLMGYVNPLLAYGADRFVDRAADCGASGLIIPDLPPAEAAAFECACQQAGLALVYLAAPTSTDERLAELAVHTRGFLYLVSLTGVTGARQDLAVGLQDFIARARRLTHVSLAVGFGISTPEQARVVGGTADGVIVGSAIIQSASQGGDPAGNVAALVRNLRQAL